MGTTATGYSNIGFDSKLNLYIVNVGARTSDINSIIKNAAAGATIEFSAGTHTLTEKLYVGRDNITVRGVSEEQTTLLLAKNLTGEGISVRGDIDDSWSTSLKSAVTEGSSTIVLKSVTGLHAGDVLMLSQANDAKFLSSGLYDNVLDSPYMSENPLRECMVEIASIDGNTVTLKHQVPYTMEAGAALVQKVDTLNHVEFSDLTITYSLGTPNPDDFSNTLLKYEGAEAIDFNYTKNVDIHDITILDAASHGMVIRNALEASVDGLTVQGAHNKGGDGNGYALHLSGSYYGSFTNLDITDVRHAVLFSSWHAEYQNYVHVTNTNRDINYHGSDDHDNTVIVDRSVYEGSDEHNWMLVSPGSTMHPYTDISKNTNLFGFAVGGFKDDTVFGRDDGAQLYGRDGNDTLTGGRGDDILSGDSGNDTLTGGGGSDLFLHAFGDGQDVITDFETGKNGDILVLDGFSGVRDMSGVLIHQTDAGAELVFLGAGSQTDSVLLKGIDASDLTADNVVFHYNAHIPMDLTLSYGADFIHAGSEADMIHSYISALTADDVVDLGDGMDTLQIISSVFTLDTGISDKLSGIDIIDTSLASGAKVIITQTFLDRTDTGNVTLLYGEAGISRLTAEGLSGQVFLSGTGTVTLADNVDNHVGITGLTAGTVQGARGDDSFYIKAHTTAQLNGGAGDDTFKLTGDWLNENMGIQGGDGFDTVIFARDMHLSASNLSHVGGIERLVFMQTGSWIQMNDSLASAMPQLVGGDTMTNISIDVSALTVPATIHVGENAKVYIKGDEKVDLTLVLDSNHGRITSGIGDDTLIGTSGRDILHSGGGNDTFYGGAGRDLLYGGSGHDNFYVTVREAKDSIYNFQGGAGGDVVHLTGFYNISSFADLNLVQAGEDTRLILNAQEYILFHDTLKGSLTADNFVFDNNVKISITMHGTTGADRFIAGAGNDVLETWVTRVTAEDIINMGAGTDTMKFMSGRINFDFTTLSATGVDILDMRTGGTVESLVLSDQLVAGAQGGTLLVKYGDQGLSGFDTSHVSSSHEVELMGGAAHIGLADNAGNRITVDAADGVVIDGGSGDDYMKLRGGSVEAHGHDGNDTFSLAADGDYALYGDAGDDLFQFNGASSLDGQTVHGGAGFDEVRLYSAANLNAADLAQVSGIDKITFYGSVNALALTSGLFETALEVRGSGSVKSLAVDITGMGDGQKLIVGENLAVTLTGLSGHDYTIETTSKTNAAVHGSVGNETMIGNTAADTLYGNDGHDALYGGYGNDKLYGGNGNDVLEGGRGADTLTGGDGNDVFRYTSNYDLGDIIKDFGMIVGNQDKIDLSELFAANNLGGKTSDEAFSGGYLALNQSGSDAVLTFDRDGAGTKYAATTVAVLEDTHAADIAHKAILV